MAETNGSTPTKEKANLALIGPMPLEGGLVPRTLEEAMNVAHVLAKSLLIPQHLRDRPADVLVTMLKGLELGLKPMHAFSEIYVVNGKPGCSAALKRALVLSSPKCEYFRCIESTPKRATYVSKRRGGEETKTTFTIEDAQTAGLTKNDTYQRHPAAMLRARASGAEADANWAEVVQGLVTLDELKEIQGQVISKTPLPRTVAPPLPSPPAPSSVEIPDEPVDDDTSWLEPEKVEEKRVEQVEQPPAAPPSNEPSEVEKVLALISEATDAKHLEALIDRIKKLTKEEQFMVKKTYTLKRTALGGAKAS